jgi:uncharacterized delta-60 repeat protein
MQFTPDRALDPDVDYTATVAGARTAAGDPGEFSWTFRTWGGASLDSTFGSGGVALRAGAVGWGLAVAPGGESWNVLKRPAGQGSGGEGLFVLKAGPDGRPDPSFAASNTMISSTSPDEYPVVARDGSGRTLVAVFNRWNGGRVARLDPLGELDPGFGVGGVAGVPGPSLMDARLRVLRVQADARPVLAFGSLADPANTLAVVRLLADGSLDRGFAAAGVLRADGTLVGLEVLPSGKLLIATTSAGCGARLARHGPDGAAESTFGSGGAVCLSGLLQAQAMKLDAGGRILVAGSSGPSTSAVLRLAPDGQLDTTYGSGGSASVPQASEVLNLAVAADGRAAVSFRLGMSDLYLIGTEGAVTSMGRLPTDVELEWSIDPLAFDGNGRLYVARGRRARPWRIPDFYPLPSDSYDELLLRFQ